MVLSTKTLFNAEVAKVENIVNVIVQLLQRAIDFTRAIADQGLILFKTCLQELCAFIMELAADHEKADIASSPHHCLRTALQWIALRHDHSSCFSLFDRTEVTGMGGKRVRVRLLDRSR